MISAIIVYGTIAAVLAYSLLYWLKPEWRHSIEQPKHVFQRQLEAYDQQHGHSGHKGSEKDEP